MDIEFKIWPAERSERSGHLIVSANPNDAVVAWAALNKIDEQTSVLLLQPNASPYPYLVRPEKDGYAAVSNLNDGGKNAFARIDKERELKINVDHEDMHFFIVQEGAEQDRTTFRSEDAAVCYAKKLVYLDPTKKFVVYMKVSRVNY